MGSYGIGKITDNGEEEMRHSMRLRAIVFGIFLVVCGMQFLGCGYTTRSMISNKFATVYIEPFVNKVDITQEAHSADRYKIYRPMLETDITRNVTNKFLFDGNLKPAAEDSADLVLRGELVEFRKDPLRYNDNNDVSEYRLNLVVNISLWDKKENKLVWQENNFTGETAYFTTGAQAKSEDTAISDALSDLARRIVERTVEQW